MGEDWIRIVFEKKFEDLSPADLDGIVTRGVPCEGQNLDFKSLFDRGAFQRNSIKNVSLAVSAFANAEGGVVLVGMEEKTVQIDGKAVKIADRVNPIRFADLTKEQLRDIIKSHISPIPLFDIRSLEYPGGSREFVYFVIVPKSEARPHQFNQDRRYYARRADSSEILLHWEIESIRDREKTYFDAEIRILPPVGGELAAELHIRNAGMLYARNVGLGVERIEPDRGRNSTLDNPLRYTESGNHFFEGDACHLMAGMTHKRRLRIRITDWSSFSNEFIVSIQSENSNLYRFRFLINQNCCYEGEIIAGDLIP